MKNTTVVESYSEEMIVSDIGTINPSFNILENYSTSGELKYLYPWRGKKVRVTLELLEDVIQETPVVDYISPDFECPIAFTYKKDGEFRFKVDRFEYLRGWGSRLNCSLYFTSEKYARKYVNWYNDRYNNMDTVPNWYMVPEYVGEVK